jgi:hypothetical protein
MRPSDLKDGRGSNFPIGVGVLIRYLNITEALETPYENTLSQLIIFPHDY